MIVRSSSVGSRSTTYGSVGQEYNRTSASGRSIRKDMCGSGQVGGREGRCLDRAGDEPRGVDPEALGALPQGDYRFLGRAQAGAFHAAPFDVHAVDAPGGGDEVVGKVRHAAVCRPGTEIGFGRATGSALEAGAL
ncbi:hypothetical protein GCM10009802_27660 [Streptomyces synnematoformans]|uniref:Uncharacterized protein n=1 Tax=Streptomyces synnematoformans TaxID=415721 RepID=A0ABP5JVT0_9ACTN